MKADVLVIGGGLAGLSAALSAQRMGADTVLLASGMGVLYLGSGCIDLMAYPEGKGAVPVSSPLDSIAGLRLENKDHPYSLVDDANLCRALDEFTQTCNRQGYPMYGDGTRNWRIPTALGTEKPTALAPATMVKGDLSEDAPIILIGFKGHRDFSPELAAEELSRTAGIRVRHAVFDAEPFMDGGTVTTVSLGRAFEGLDFCREVAAFIEKVAGLDQRIGLPAVLGVDYAGLAHQRLEEFAGRPVFEIPILPPSLPGRRIYQVMKRELFELGGQVIYGCPVVKTHTSGDKVERIEYKAGGNIRSVTTGAVVLATGSFFSGGLTCTRNSVRETIFDLPLKGVPKVDGRYRIDFLDMAGHPLCKAGVSVNSNFTPCDEKGEAVYSNLFACGDLLAGFDSLVERSGGGVAIATGTIAGENGSEAAGL